MPLIRLGQVADDDGDTILIEAEPGAVYLTLNPEKAPGGDGRCVALRREQRDQFARAWTEADTIAEGGADGE